VGRRIGLTGVRQIGLQTAEGLLGFGQRLLGGGLGFRGGAGGFGCAGFGLLGLSLRGLRLLSGLSGLLLRALGLFA
jgi:hypothetical protein